MPQLDDRFSLQVSLERPRSIQGFVAFDASRGSVWLPLVGAELQSVAILSWNLLPQVLEFAFPSGGAVIGTGYVDVLGDGDDLITWSSGEFRGDDHNRDVQLLWDAHLR